MEPSRSRQRIGLVLLTIGLFAIAIIYRSIDDSLYLEPWSYFFHGFPAVIAIGLAFMEPPENLKGKIFLGITLGLLLAGTLLGEGFICVIIAAPIFYLLGAVWYVIIRDKDTKRARSFALLLLFVTSWAVGVVPAPSTTVTVETATDLMPPEVRAAIAIQSDVPPVRGGLLGSGLPNVASVTGSGLEVGDIRNVTFSDGGVLSLEVVASDRRSVKFVAVDDTSAYDKWLTWESAQFRWEKSATGSQVELSIVVARELQPGWYFEPLVRMGMRQAANHLLTSLLND